MTATMQQPMARRDGLVIGLVGLAHLASHFFQLALAPLFPTLRDAFGVSYLELGSVSTCFFLASGICQAFAGIFVDRFGARPILLFGVAAMATAIGLIGMAPQFWMLYPLAVIAGIGNSVFHPADLSLLSTRVSEHRLGRAYSVHAFLGTVGYAIAPIAVGAIAALAGWRAALISAGLAGWVVVALLVVFRHALAVSEDGTGPFVKNDRNASYGALVANPAVVLAFFYFLFTAAAGTGVQTFSTAAMVELYRISVPAAASALTAYLAGSCAGILLGGVIADRTTKHARVAMTGLAVSALLILTLSFGTLDFPLAVVVIAAAGMGQGATGPSRDLLVRGAAPKGATGKVFGLVYSGLDAGCTLAPMVYGALLDRHAVGGIFLMIAALFGVSVFTVLSVARTSQAKVA